MDYLIAFVAGGLICVIGQLLLDVLKLTPAHVMTTFVVAGTILDGFGIYDKFIEFAGAGATVPIVSFGHSLLHGAMHQADVHGFIGIGIGIFELTSAGISGLRFYFHLSLHLSLNRKDNLIWGKDAKSF